MKSIIDRFEIPTWLVIVAVHASWLTLTYFHDRLPLALLTILGMITVCWHMHLQHEILHGHPTRWRRINEIFAYLPMAVWIPYPIYRDSHQAHHSSDHLSAPDSDPESYYLSTEQWASLPWPVQQLLVFNNTVAGRMLVGPFITIGRFWFEELLKVAHGNLRHLPAWLGHGVCIAGLVWWLTAISEMPVGLYLLTFAWPGTALALLRSYIEHRPSANPDERTAIVENTPLFGLLFLNNNLHVVHHEKPGMPWYRIGGFYKANREDILRRNGGFCFNGYGDVLRHYLLTPKDIPVHHGAAAVTGPTPIPVTPAPLACEAK